MPDPCVAVCAMVRCLPDDVADRCALCAHPIFLRPYTAASVPPEHRICLECWLKVRETSQPIVISRESIEELALLYANTKSVQ